VAEWADEAQRVAAIAAPRAGDRPFHVVLAISAWQLTALAGMLMVPIITLRLLAFLYFHWTGASIIVP
jgi:hypothetical protein